MDPHTNPGSDDSTFEDTLTSALTTFRNTQQAPTNPTTTFPPQTPQALQVRTHSHQTQSPSITTYDLPDPLITPSATPSTSAEPAQPTSNPSQTYLWSKECISGTFSATTTGPRTSKHTLTSTHISSTLQSRDTGPWSEVDERALVLILGSGVRDSVAIAPVFFPEREEEDVLEKMDEVLRRAGWDRRDGGGQEGLIAGVQQWDEEAEVEAPVAMSGILGMLGVEAWFET